MKNIQHLPVPEDEEEEAEEEEAEEQEEAVQAACGVSFTLSETVHQ